MCVDGAGRFIPLLKQHDNLKKLKVEKELEMFIAKEESGGDLCHLTVAGSHLPPRRFCSMPMHPAMVWSRIHQLMMMMWCHRVRSDDIGCMDRSPACCARAWAWELLTP